MVPPTHGFGLMGEMPPGLQALAGQAQRGQAQRRPAAGAAARMQLEEHDGRHDTQPVEDVASGERESYEKNILSLQLEIPRLDIVGDDLCPLLSFSGGPDRRANGSGSPPFNIGPSPAHPTPSPSASEVQDVRTLAACSTLGSRQPFGHHPCAQRGQPAEPLAQSPALPPREGAHPSHPRPPPCQGDAAAARRRLWGEATAARQDTGSRAAGALAADILSGSGAATRVGDNLSDVSFDNGGSWESEQEEEEEEKEGHAAAAAERRCLDGQEAAGATRKHPLPLSLSPVRSGYIDGPPTAVSSGLGGPLSRPHTLRPTPPPSVEEGDAEEEAWLCERPASLPRKRGRPRKPRPVSDALIPLTQPGTTTRLAPRTVSSVAKQLAGMLGDGAWPVEVVAAALNNAVLACAAPRITLEAAESRGSQKGESEFRSVQYRAAFCAFRSHALPLLPLCRCAGQEWQGWSQPEAEQRGLLRALMSCAMETDSLVSASHKTGGGLIGALLPRLRAQACCVAGGGEADGSGGAAVRGLHPLQTERCAAAAAYAVVCRETGSVRTFRSLVVDLCGGFGPAPLDTLLPPTLLAPLFSAISQWPQACFPMTIPEPASTLKQRDRPSPEAALPPDYRLPSLDPIGLALHCALSHLLSGLASLPASQLPPATAVSGRLPQQRLFVSRVSSEPELGIGATSSLSGSTSTEQDWNISVALAQRAIALLSGGVVVADRQSPATLGCTENQPKSPSGGVSGFKASCRQLLGVIRWGLCQSVGSHGSGSGDEGSAAAARGGDPLPVTTTSGRADVGGKRDRDEPLSTAASAACEQACSVLILLTRMAGFAETYEQVTDALPRCLCATTKLEKHFLQVARVLLDDLPNMPVNVRPAVVNLSGRVCRGCLVGRQASNEELKACMLLANGLVSALDDDAVGEELRHACARSAFLCAEVAVEAAAPGSDCEREGRELLSRVRELMP